MNVKTGTSIIVLSTITIVLSTSIVVLSTNYPRGMNVDPGAIKNPPKVPKIPEHSVKLTTNPPEMPDTPLRTHEDKIHTWAFARKFRDKGRAVTP